MLVTHSFYIYVSLLKTHTEPYVHMINSHAYRISLHQTCFVMTPNNTLSPATWRCRKNFSQWDCSFLWKLRCHWLKFLRRVAKTLVIQGPGSYCLNRVLLLCIKFPLLCISYWFPSFTRWRHQMETFPRYWPFLRGIHRSPVKSPHKGQWRGALMFSLICTRTNGWVNNREAGDLRRHRAHYDVIVM